jgi:hypothetical protein
MMRFTVPNEIARTMSSSARSTNSTRAPQSSQINFTSAAVRRGLGVATAMPTPESPHMISMYSKQLPARMAARSPERRFRSPIAAELTRLMRETSAR